MTLFDPYSHARIQELRQEQLTRKAHLREKIGFETRGTLSSTRLFERIANTVGRLSGRHSVPPSPQPGSVRTALDS